MLRQRTSCCSNATTDKNDATTRSINNDDNTTTTTTTTIKNNSRFIRIQLNNNNTIKYKNSNSNNNNNNNSNLFSFIQQQSIQSGNFILQLLCKNVLLLIILLQLLAVDARSVSSLSSSSLSSLTLSSIIRKKTYANGILSISSQQSSKQSSISRSSHLLVSIPLSLRGGSSSSTNDSENDKDKQKQSTESSCISGTSSTTISEEDTIEKEQLQLYNIQQQLLLNSRSLQLRQLLISKGIVELHHTSTDASQNERNKKYQIVDWECSIATQQYPKSCLYTFDAEIGSKVIAPLLLVDDDTDDTEDNDASTDKQKQSQSNKQNYQWITLSSLNRLRRNDITKVEPLYHNQYSILDTWFGHSNMYSLYQHIPIIGQIISFLLDESIILMSVCIVLLLLGTIVLLPLIEYSIIHILLKNKFVWIYWANWSRFIHSALPLQLAILQMILKLIQSLIYQFFYYIRTILIEYECTLFEHYTPITYNEEIEIKQNKQLHKEQVTDSIVNKLNSNNDNNKVIDDDEDDDENDDTTDNDDQDDEGDDDDDDENDDDNDE